LGVTWGKRLWGKQRSKRTSIALTTKITRGLPVDLAKLVGKGLVPPAKTGSPKLNVDDETLALFPRGREDTAEN